MAKKLKVTFINLTDESENLPTSRPHREEFNQPCKKFLQNWNPTEKYGMSSFSLFSFISRLVFCADIAQGFKWLWSIKCFHYNLREFLLIEGFRIQCVVIGDHNLKQNLNYFLLNRSIWCFECFELWDQQKHWKCSKHLGRHQNFSLS